MALVSAKDFQLVPDIQGAVGQGIQTAGQLQQLQGISQARDVNEQTQLLTGQILDQSLPPAQRAEAQRQLTALNPQASQQLQTMQTGQRKDISEQEQGELRSIAQGALQIQALTTDDQKLGALRRRRAEIVERGGNTVETDNVINMFETGQTDLANQQIENAVRIGERLGFIKPTTTGDVDFLKEERKTASQDVRSFNNKAREMRVSFTKMEGLADQAKTGSRGARNAMVVSLARLISPGIVTETEASNLAGGQNSMQAVFQALSGKGFDVKDLQTYVDPFGETFDAEGLLQVGKSVVTSSRQPLIDMFENSQARAVRSGMSQKSIDTNFTDNPNFAYLQSFGVDEGDDLTPKDKQPPAPPQEGATATNPQTGQKVIFTNGQWQPAS